MKKDKGIKRFKKIVIEDKEYKDKFDVFALSLIFAIIAVVADTFWGYPILSGTFIFFTLLILNFNRLNHKKIRYVEVKDDE